MGRKRTRARVRGPLKSMGAQLLPVAPLGTKATTMQNIRVVCPNIHLPGRLGVQGIHTPANIATGLDWITWLMPLARLTGYTPQTLSALSLFLGRDVMCEESPLRQVFSTGGFVRQKAHP